MIEVKNGKIFVEGVETIDAELIGMAFLDIIEDNPKASVIVATDKKLISIIDNQTELSLMNNFVENEMKEMNIQYEFSPDFHCNWPSTHILYNFIVMIKNKSLIFINKN